MRITLFVLLMFCATGCVMPFSGKRNVKCDINILGNTCKWESSVAGQYYESPLAIDAGKK